MPELPERPVRRSPRRKGHDYSLAATYLITTNVDLREPRFGTIERGAVTLNDAGGIVEDIWRRLPGRFPGIELDAHVVMPDHFHGIVVVGTDPEVAPPTLIRVVQAFKSEVAVRYGRGIRDGRFPTLHRALWQRSFHDALLPDARALELARTYVADNPRAWQEGRDHEWGRCR